MKKLNLEDLATDEQEVFDEALERFTQGPTYQMNKGKRQLNPTGWPLAAAAMAIRKYTVVSINR